MSLLLSRKNWIKLLYPAPTSKLDWRASPHRQEYPVDPLWTAIRTRCLWRRTRSNCLHWSRNTIRKRKRGPSSRANTMARSSRMIRRLTSCTPISRMLTMILKIRPREASSQGVMLRIIDRKMDSLGKLSILKSKTWMQCRKQLKMQWSKWSLRRTKRLRRKLSWRNITKNYRRLMQHI